MLVITKGFGDTLRIGYQNRPRLFDMYIKLPELVYESVIEADERIATDGEILKPLAEDALRDSLQAVFDDGVRSIAITFMHGYRHHKHEISAGAIAKKNRLHTDFDFAPDQPYDQVGFTWRHNRC